MGRQKKKRTVVGALGNHGRDWPGTSQGDSLEGGEPSQGGAAQSGVACGAARVKHTSSPFFNHLLIFLGTKEWNMSNLIQRETTKF